MFRIVRSLRLARQVGALRVQGDGNGRRAAGRIGLKRQRWYGRAQLGTMGQAKKKEHAFVHGNEEDPQERVLDFLEAHHVEYKQSGDEIRIRTCPKCHDTKGDPSNEFKLSLNPVKNAYNCVRCLAKGSLKNDALKALFMENEDSYAERLTSSRGEEVQPRRNESQPATALNVRNDLDDAQLEAMFKHIQNTRGLKREVLELYNCKFVNRGFWDKDSNGFIPHTCIAFPYIAAPGEFDEAAALANYDEEPGAWISNQQVQRIKLRAIDEKRHQRIEPAKSPTGLFGWHLVPRKEKSIIITEGEYDAMAVYQETKRPAVSVPNGANALQQPIIDALEKFETIYLFMDQDKQGRSAEATLYEQLGKYRCKFVRLPNGIKDANEALLERISLEKCVREATSPLAETVVGMTALQQAVLFFAENPPNKGAKFSSLPALTSILKGHRDGELTVFTGPTGSGKTTLLTQLTLDLLEEGIPTLWGSFEIKWDRLVYNMAIQHWGMPNEAGEISALKPSDAEIKHHAMHHETFKNLPLYCMDYFSTTSVEDVMETMHFAANNYGIKHIVIDNLQFMMSPQRGDRVKEEWGPWQKYEDMDYAVACFRRFASDMGVHVTVVIHPRKEPEGDNLSIASFFGTGKATQEADNVIILNVTKKGEKFLDVKKNRFDGTLGRIPITFKTSVRRFVDISEEAISKREEGSSNPEDVQVIPAQDFYPRRLQTQGSTSTGDVEDQLEPEQTGETELVQVTRASPDNQDSSHNGIGEW